MTTSPSVDGSVGGTFLSGKIAGALHTLRSNWHVLIFAVVLGYLVLSPLIFMLISSLKPTGLPFDPGWTITNITSVYTDARTYDLLGNTLAFVVGSTILALTVSVPLAWLVERSDLPLRRTFRALIIMPMAMPPVLMAISWVMLTSPRTGAFNQVLRALFGPQAGVLDPFTLPGMVFVQALTVVPSTFLILSPAFRNMDPNLEEAALASGASPWKTVRRIMLPVLRPAILAAGIYLTIVGFVVFDVPGTLGLPVRRFVLSTEVYTLATAPSGGLPDYGRISALAGIFLLVLVALSVVYQRLTRESQRFVTVTGKNYKARRIPLRKWRWPAAAFLGGYFALAGAAPLAILTWTSLLPYQTGISPEMLGQLTLANHLNFLGNTRIIEAVTNSVVVAFVSATLVALLAVLVSWIVVRSNIAGRRVIDTLSFLPMAMPGVMVGMALIFVYLTINVIPVYGTIWILVIAYTTIYLAFGSRVTHGVMHQMSPDLEDAAATSGAGWLRTLRRVTIPLMSPGIAAVWIWVFAHAMRELSSALLLQGRSNTVVSTLLWGYWTSGDQVTAAAVGVWLIVVLLIAVGAWQLLTRRHGVEETMT